MMESAAYEMIKKEGYDEGLQQGIQQGVQQGMLEDAREMVLEALAERFGVIPADLEKCVLAMDSRRQLKELLRQVLRVQSLEEFQKLLS
jgi:flagellar biosynthesis/type III secretory pathway protein FliH